LDEKANVMSAYGGNRLNRGDAGGGGVGVTPYELNPAGSTDVVMLFDFTEASGNVIDSISGVELVPSGGSVATNLDYETFKYASTDPTNIYSGITPGIGFRGLSAFLTDTTAPAAISPGTKSFTLELWYSVIGRAAGNYLLSLCNPAFPTNGGFLLTIGSFSTGAIGYYLRATDGTTINGNTSAPTLTHSFDGGLHKMRIVHHRPDAKLYIYVDEELVGNINAAALTGKTIQFDAMYLNCTWVPSGEGIANYYGLRLSHNATNNSGGPDVNP
jgi:hypothetical protein